MKRFLSGLLTLALLSSCASPAEAKPAYTKENVRLIMCNGGLGTAFVVGKNLLVTANHVFSIGGCKDGITGEPAKLVERDVNHDFVLFKIDTGQIKPVKYSCARYEKGRTHVSVGYGQGNYQTQKMVPLEQYTVKGFTVGEDQVVGMRALDGTIIPGMSGGPIFDSKGYAHGLNNVYGPGGLSYSFELADTPLCSVNLGEARPLPPVL